MSLRWPAWNLFFSLFFSAFPLFAEPETSAGGVDFEREIRPLLADRCFHCHGPDAEQREGDLRLDEQEGALADLGGYRAIVPGDVDASHLIERITADDPDERMPPPDSARKLSQEEIAKLKQWIAEGATWKAHWAFRPITSPPPPSVKEKNWPRNPIDHFVLARLEDKGFVPADPVARS